MIIIGLTGPSGSGKGIVSDLLREQEIPVIDTDAIYHEITSQETPCVEELAQAFGKDIVREGGGIDRHRLASIVFCGGDLQRERCGVLNRITHTYVLKEVRVLLASFRASGCRISVVDAPLLFESGFDAECDKVISVLADAERRTERICLRDHITVEEAKARISAQKTDDFFRQNSDFVIDNNGSIDELRANVATCVKELRKVAGTIGKEFT